MDSSTIGAGEGAAVRTFEALAELQGVHPVADFDLLLGRPSIDDESTEEFQAMLREWRCEGDRSTHNK